MNRYIGALCIALFVVLPAHAAGVENLVNRVAESSKISKEEAKKQIDAVVESIKAELVAGQPITIRDFGRFHVVSREARMGRNPKTGAQISIPAKRYPRFNSADGFKQSLNQ